MVRYMKLFAALGICWGSLLGYVETASAKQNPITAINIALDPDVTMTRHVEAANARLLKVYQKGFALDASHKPHITILQRYVRTENLNQIYAAADEVLTHEKIADWQLKASRYYYTPWNHMGLGGIMVEPTDDLLTLQQKLIDAVAPFTVKIGTAAAYFTPPEDPDINQTTIDYVAAFVPKATGSNFKPHITIGIASPHYLKEMIAEPFNAFTFSPAGVSVYQLGNFGTARKKLKEWELKP
jgi:2'-5' RNA ligase